MILLALVFVWIQFFPPGLFFVFLQIFILGALFEFYNLFRKRQISLPWVLGMVLSLIIAVSFFTEKVSWELAFFIVLFLAAVYFVTVSNKVEKALQFPTLISLTLLGAVYLSFTLNHFYFLKVEKGPLYIYFFLAVIFIGDTGAYFIGKLVGKHKMLPIASPRKTWEGSLGGVLFACGGALGFILIFFPEVILWKGLLCAFLLHSVAQVSDPLESLFKRAVGVKDSSGVFPGHGGILDRVDSLILGAPFFYYFLKFLGLR